MVDLAAALATVAPSAAVDSDVLEYVQEALAALQEGTAALEQDDVEAMCMPLEDFLGDALPALVQAVLKQTQPASPSSAADSPAAAAAEEGDAPKPLQSGALRMSAGDAVHDVALSISSAGLHAGRAQAPSAGASISAQSPADEAGIHDSAPAVPAAGAGSAALSDHGSSSDSAGDEEDEVACAMGLVDWDSGALRDAAHAAEAFAHVDDASGGFTEGVLASSWRHTAMGGTGGSSRNVAVRQLTIATPGGELLSNASLVLEDGHKYGLVGRNGSGKSTLLRRMVQGSIPGFPPHLRTAMIQFKPAPPGVTPLQLVLRSDTRRRRLLSLARALEALEAGEAGTPVPPPAEASAEAPVPPGLMEALAAQPPAARSEALEGVSAELLAMDAQAAPARAAQALVSVGLPVRRHGEPLAALSGGWQMRVAIACAVFQEPDILVADEPSNHLDLEGVWWMGRYLADLDCTCVVVSHDTAFLDMFVTDIIHLHQQGLHSYSTNYAGFVAAREEKAGMMNRLQANLDRKRAHYAASAKRMEEAAAGKLGKGKAGGGRKLSRLKGDEKKSKQVAQRRHRMQYMGLDKTLDGKKFSMQRHSRRLGSAVDNAGGWVDGKMTAAAVNTDREESVQFDFATLAGCDGSVAQPIVALDDVAFRYPGASADTLRGVSLALDTTSRIGIVGANGSGKTTLLRMLAGAAEATSGEVVRAPGTRVAYFSQHHADQLDLSKTPVQHLCEVAGPGVRPQHLRNLLGKFGIAGATAVIPMRDLSGGQLSRVSLTCLFLARPHMLVADEITNFFDTHSIDALVQGLQDFTGAVVLVSHNLALLKSVCSVFYVVADGALRRLEGGLDEYLAAHAAALPA